MNASVSLERNPELQKQAGIVSAVGLQCHNCCASVVRVLCTRPQPILERLWTCFTSTETWHFGSTKTSIYAGHRAAKFLIPGFKV